jgi:hypothetical protein
MQHVSQPDREPDRQQAADHEVRDLDPAPVAQAQQAERMPAEIEPVAEQHLKEGDGHIQRAGDHATRQ